MKRPGILRPVVPADAPGITGIYNHYISHTAITFEEEILSPRDMEDRIRDVIPRYPWLVWEEEGELAGYAYAHAWRQQGAYRWAAEDTIYLKPGWERRGIGKRLLEGVIGELRKGDFHVLMAVITVPNPASVGLHEGLGFIKAGQFNEIGFKLGKRQDVGYWELILGAAGPGTIAPEGAAGRAAPGPAEGAAFPPKSRGNRK